MDTAQLEELAISASLSSNWDGAIKANLAILSKESENVNAMNRLAHAYANSGNAKDAQKLSQKVLQIDPYNGIAIKAANKWGKYEPGIKPQSSKILSNNLFLEEPGKTKIVDLVCPGNEKSVASLEPGEEVLLSAHFHRVTITNSSKKFIGRLPDDLSARMRKLIRLGHTYQVLIKSSDAENVKIFIKEINKGDKAKDVISFPTDSVKND